MCHDGATERLHSALLWLGTLTTVLLTVLGTLYIEFKQTMRMLIQVGWPSIPCFITFAFDGPWVSLCS